MLQAIIHAHYIVIAMHIYFFVSLNLINAYAIYTYLFIMHIFGKSEVEVH